MELSLRSPQFHLLGLKEIPLNIEGTRRLSLFLGTMGSIGWLIFILIVTEFFGHAESIPPKAWLIMLAGIPFFFIVPYGLVKGIAWVIGGFKRDKQNVDKVIKTTFSSTTSPDTAHKVDQTSEKIILINPPIFKEISFLKLIAYILLLPVAIILLDIIFGITFSKLLQELAETKLRLIAYLLYFSLGIWLADYIYRLKKATDIIVISLPILFIYRFVIAAIYKPELFGQAMTNTLEEGLVVYITLSLFSFLFRHFEPKFDFAEIKNKFESRDPITGKKCDSGTCSKCGGITIIGRERFISFFSFLGKSSEYFCGNCNRFIMGNPLNNIFLGITESVAFFLFMGGLAPNMQGKSSSHLSIVILILLVGIYDGIKRVFFGIKGVKSSIIK